MPIVKLWQKCWVTQILTSRSNDRIGKSMLFIFPVAFQTTFIHHHSLKCERTTKMVWCFGWRWELSKKINYDFIFKGLALKSITFVTSFVKFTQVIIYRCHCLPLDTFQPCEHDKLQKPACLFKFPSLIQLQHLKHDVLRPLVAILSIKFVKEI